MNFNSYNQTSHMYYVIIKQLNTVTNILTTTRNITQTRDWTVVKAHLINIQCLRFRLISMSMISL